MAGHSKFANIKHRKGAQDIKKAKLFTKLQREIYVAAKSGLVDPEFNNKLKLAIAKAKALNMPKDKIDFVLKKAAGSNSAENYEEIRYNGHAPGGIAIIVETLTDNKNRTAAEIRAIFNKAGGNLGETGGVEFMFDHIGYITYDAKIAGSEDMLEGAILAGADNVESDEDLHIIECAKESLGSVREYFENKYGESNESGLMWKPKNEIEVSDNETALKILKLIDILEDNDDVQEVTTNAKLPEDVGID